MQGGENIIGFLGSTRGTEANILCIVNGHHYCDIIGKNTYNVKFSFQSAYVLALQALYDAYALRGIDYKLIGTIHKCLLKNRHIRALL